MPWCDWNGDPESYQEWADACGMPAVFELKVVSDGTVDGDSCAKHLGPYVNWLAVVMFDQAKEIHIRRTEFSPIMVGTEVIHVDAEPGPEGKPWEGQPPGYVAHAKLSDGTLSWPMGAKIQWTLAEAQVDTKYIRWTATGPEMSEEYFGHPTITD